MKYFCLIAALSISSFCFAQSPIIIFIKNNGEKTDSRDSALLVRTVTAPIGGSNLYGFSENFVTGEPFREGKTLDPDDIMLEDTCTIYYPSGKKLSKIFFRNGLEQTGTFYFADGTVFKVCYFSRSAHERITTTCNDSTGKALVTNGKGYFINYTPVIDKRFVAKATDRAYCDWLDNEFKEGEMKNGIMNGTWKGNTEGLQYTELYRKGKFVSGESEKDGKHYRYDANTKEQDAVPPGGTEAFYTYLASTIHYPVNDEAKNIQGKVRAIFMIDTDGSLSNIKILKSPSNDMADETIRVLKLSPPWVPATERGVPIQQFVTFPITYEL